MVMLFHDRQKLLSRKLADRCRNDLRLVIEAADQLHILLHLFMLRHIRTAQHNGTCKLYLIIEELAEVLHIHPALIGVHDGNGRVQLNGKICGSVLHCLHDVGKLSNS